MRLMETYMVMEGDQKVKGVPYTTHMVIDKHGNVQPIRADRHQRDWMEFEYERGAIIVNLEPLGDQDIPNGRGGFRQVGPKTIAARLEEHKAEIEKRRAANLREIEMNRANSAKARGRTEAATAMSEAMATAFKQFNGAAAGGDVAALMAKVDAIVAENAAMKAELAELKAAPAPAPVPEPRKK